MKALGYITRVFNITLSEVAKNLDVTPQTINDWVKGKRAIPKERLGQLEELFQIDGDFFQLEEINLSEFQRLKIKISYLKSINELKYDAKYPYYSHEKEINQLSKKLEDARLLHEIGKLFEGGTRLEDDDYNWKAVRNYRIYEKITEILTEENAENNELVKKLIILLFGEMQLEAYSTAQFLSEIIREERKINNGKI
jgi:transcriptional regulator with XRE-family HTH domain